MGGASWGPGLALYPPGGSLLGGRHGAVQEGGCGGRIPGTRPDSLPPGGSFHSVPPPGDLMLTYGISYYLASSDSRFYGSSLDLSPDLPIRALSGCLTTFSGIAQGHLQLQVTSHPPPLLLVLLNEGYHPQPNPSPAPLALSPEHFRNHSLSSVSLTRCPSPYAFLSHLDGVSSLFPHIRPFWPLASSSWPAISLRLGQTAPVGADSLPSGMAWSQRAP